MTAKKHPLAPATRMAEIEPFHVMEMMAQAAQLEQQGHPIIHMEVGEPDFDTAEPIVKAGVAALENGHTHYTQATGRIELKQAISDWYQQQHQTRVPTERIQITVGASGALQMTFWALLDPGDEVLLADPGYPCNQNFVRLAGGIPVSLPTEAESGWRVTPELITAALTNKTRALLIASPNNPTGTVMNRAEMTAIATLCADHGIALIVDEIYNGLTYGVPSFSAVELAENPSAGLFVINSFSKYFGMTGWRLGWMVCPESFVRPLEKLAQNLFIAPPTAAQFAGEAAFKPQTISILEQRREAFQERRDLLLSALRGLRFHIPATPDGAFYLFADITGFGVSSGELCKHLLNQAGVAITPGIDFSHGLATDYVRFAYTTDLEQIERAIANIAPALKSLN